MNYWDIIDSNLFQTIITLIVGMSALYVYQKQKADYKSNAANSILIEIQNAESVIDRARESVRRERLEIDSVVMPTNSWNKYKQIFSKDFDRDEWDAISQFYNKCMRLDESIKYNSSAFANDVEAIRSNRQRILADYVKELLSIGSEKTPEQALNEFNQKANIFDKVYMSKQGEYAYAPVKPLNDAKIYLEDLRPLSTTTIGQKLKAMTK